MRRLKRGRIVLWGRRLGDIQFGSLDDWRRHIPVGAVILKVDSNAGFDVGGRMLLVGPDVTCRIAGLEPGCIGVWEL